MAQKIQRNLAVEVAIVVAFISINAPSSWASALSPATPPPPSSSL
jgi:hypothetical protein